MGDDLGASIGRKSPGRTNDPVNHFRLRRKRLMAGAGMNHCAESAPGWLGESFESRFASPVVLDPESQATSRRVCLLR